MTLQSFKNLLNQTVSVRRNTDVLRTVEGITASMSLGTQPDRAVKLLAKVAAGSIGSGTIILNGTVNSVSDSENLVFSENGFKESSKQFTEITSITESGFTDEATVATLEVLARSAAGQPIFQEVVQFETKARIEGISSGKIGSFSIQVQGSVVNASHFMFSSFDVNQQINEKDIITDEDGTRFEVLPYDIVDDRVQKSHYEIPLMRRI